MKASPKSSSIFSRSLVIGIAATALLSGGSLFSVGCSAHHWAQVEESNLPPPPGPKVMHTDRIVVHVTDEANETQCVTYENYHPVCFHNIRQALTRGLGRSLWPSFPEVVVGNSNKAGPSDYLLQIEVTLDALPPDDAGPGWSAGARSRFRVIREGKVIAEETLATRSRAQFPYGGPLGEGATEVIDATVLHVATAVSRIPESRPDEPKPLPRVAARKVELDEDGQKTNPSKSEAKSEATAATAPATEPSAKSAPPSATKDKPSKNPS